MRRTTARLRHWFFPPRIDPPECVREALRVVYPTVDWTRVTFRDGWPHLLGFSPNTAITLPATYSLGRVDVHVKPGRWNPCTSRGLGLIVHEGFHVLQLTGVAGGRGPGFARAFIVHYLAAWASNGFRYDDHPMENAAYAVAGRATSRFERCADAGPGPARSPCDCGSDPPRVDPVGLEQLRTRCRDVVQTSGGDGFWMELARSTPGLVRLHRGVARRSRLGAWLVSVPLGIYYAAWLLTWSVVAVVLGVLKVAVEVVGAVVTGLLWLATALTCLLARDAGSGPD